MREDIGRVATEDPLTNSDTEVENVEDTATTLAAGRLRDYLRILPIVLPVLVPFALVFEIGFIGLILASIGTRSFCLET